MKSYTDLSQSKKLAEILPLESADWTILNCFNEFGKKDGSNIRVIKEVNTLNDSVEKIPCWSLAALISIIPQEIFDGEYIINITEGLNNRWILTYDHYENRNHSYCGLSIGADNPVDACYEMILKLHELKML